MERPIPVQSKKSKLLPHRMVSASALQSAFLPQKEVLKKQEERIANFDLALSKLPPTQIKKLMEDQKASQKVYESIEFPKQEKRPITRIEKNMMMFKKIFIDPEVQRIEGLKVKEAEFSNLVQNVVNDQYDKLLEVTFKKLHAGRKDLASTRAESAQPTSFQKRPYSSLSSKQTLYE